MARREARVTRKETEKNSRTNAKAKTEEGIAAKERKERKEKNGIAAKRHKDEPQPRNPPG